MIIQNSITAGKSSPGGIDRVRSLVTGWALTAVFLPALSFAGVSSSPNYAVSHQTFDWGGGFSGSANYANHGSIGEIAGAGEAATPIYVVRHGFVGQIHDAPIVAIGAADEITRTEGRMHGTVNPNTMSTDIWFEWGTTPTLGTIVPLANLSPGAIAEAVSAAIESLAPGTEYHYRLVASNADGTVQSAPASFATIANLPPLAPPVTLERLPNLSAKILVADLLAGASDPEDDPIAFDGVAPASANGGQVFVSGGWVLYLPPDGFNSSDSFTYTISDNFGAADPMTPTPRAMHGCRLRPR